MNHDTMTRTQQCRRKSRIQSRLRRIVVVLACVVVFCTTYAMILPALTTETEIFCGFEEHSHTQSCYRRLSSLVMTLDCEEHLRNPHAHTDDCYNGAGNLICGKAEYYAHTHADHCYNATGELVCKMPERSTHVHDVGCYEPIAHTSVHRHGEDCYASVQDQLVCTVEESAGHRHEDACYEQTLLCTVDDETHSHEEACYELVLLCEVEENPGHSHAEDCYSYKQELICTLAETAPTEDPFVTPQSHAVICGELEAVVHVHERACFRTTELVLTCGLAEDVNHKHSDLCYGNWELHCTLQEHSHSLSCYANPRADVESREDWENSIATVKATGNWGKDMVEVAVSQLGYTESAKNYQVMDDGTVKGYSRYGQWYGDPYGDWCAMFVAFCMNYSGVKDVPTHASCSRWVEALSAENVNLYRQAPYHNPLPGDIVFLDFDSNDRSDHIGLVAEVLYNKETDKPEKIKVIEGNSSNRVQYVTYKLNDEVLLGYGDINRAYEEYRIDHAVQRIYHGDGFKVSVSLMHSNDIPDDAELVVEKITPDYASDVYDAGYMAAHILLTEEFSAEPPPVMEDYQLFDISFRKDGQRIAPVGNVEVELTFTADGELYETYQSYVVTYKDGEASLPAIQSISSEYDTITASLPTDTLDLIAVLAADIRSQSYMSRTAVDEENLDDLSGTFALISENYALLTEGTAPTVAELETALIDGKSYIPADSSLEIWEFTQVESNTYHIATEIDGQTYYLCMDIDGQAAPTLYLSTKEKTVWMAESVTPELRLKGNGAYLDISPIALRAKVEEPTVGLYKANDYQALVDCQFGAHEYYASGDIKYEGADRYVLNCNEQNQITLPATVDSTGAYPYRVVGWYDIVNKVYYGEEYLGSAITLTKDIVLYPDYVAESYDIGNNVNVVQNQPRLSFVETHLFDYNELFNLRGAYYDGTFPNITTRENTWDLNKWTVNEQGFSFVLTDWIHSGSSDGNIGRPLDLGTVNSVNNDDRTYNAYDVPNFVGHITEGIFNEDIKAALFSHDDDLGRHYLGRADMLYQYDSGSGFYFYNSALNAASYNQSAGRFYVYDYTAGVQNDSSIHDFLPLNYVEKGGAELDDVGSEVNFWFGMTSEITFFLPDNVGSAENVDSNGMDMQFRFSGDDDVWVFVDDQLVLDMGGVHDIVYGEINFATGDAKTAAESARNSASPSNNYMPGIDGTHGNITTTRLPDLEPGEMHTLTVYYMERGSSLSNCAIYFNLAPMYELEIVKRDAKGQNLLEGAVFEVYEDRECTVRANLMVVDEYGNTSHPQQFTTNEVGMILCSGLIAGKTYYIKEVQPPTRPNDHPGYPDMSKYLIQLSLGSSGKPTVLVLNSEDEEWVYADAHRFSETGTRVSLTVYNEVGVGGNAKVYVEKVWDETDALEHDPIIVELLANGEPTGRSLTLSDANEWKGFFLELPELDGDGNEIVYTIKEINAPPGYKVSYTRLEPGNSVTTTEMVWEQVKTLENGGKYIFVSDGVVLSTADGDYIAMDISADVALASKPGGQSFVWDSTASGTGFYLKSESGNYLTIYNSAASYFYQTASPNTYSVMNFQPEDGKLYGLRGSNKYFLRFIEGGYGQAGRQANNGLSFTIYKWMEKETTTVTDYEGWRITNSLYEEQETVAIPVKKVWDDNVPANRIIPIEVDLYLAPDDGGQATLIRSLTLSQENGWTDIFEGLIEPEDGYHYYVAERTGGFVVTYNGTTARIRIGPNSTDTITAMLTQPMTEEDLLNLKKFTTKATPPVISTESLYFGFDTNQNPLHGWTHTRESLLGDIFGAYVPVYASGGNLVVEHVYNDITIVEYTENINYTVKPEDHFEISFYLDGVDSMAWATELTLRITVDGELHEIDLGTVQTVEGQVQTFTSGELGLSGNVTSIGFFIDGYYIYSDFMYVDYMYLGTNEEPEPPTEPPTEPSEPDPAEPSEPESTDPTEPDPTEPSEPDPTEPSEPDEPENPEGNIYDQVVITNRCPMVDIPVEKDWEGVNPDIMNPITLQLYLVEEITGEGGIFAKTVTFVQEVTLTKDTQWKNTFPNVLLPESNAYYVVVEKAISGYHAFYEGDTTQISIDGASPVTGVRVDLTAAPVATVKLTNAPATELPSTGGEGLLLYTMGGALLVSLAVVLLMYSRKNKRRKGDMFPF